MRALPNPLHTRLLMLTLGQEGASEHAVAARVVDVRKRGMVPLLGLLNGPGVVHDMELRLTVGRDDLTIRAASLRMHEVPFPAGPGTRGESCRDNESGTGGASASRSTGVSARRCSARWAARGDVSTSSPCCG